MVAQVSCARAAQGIILLSLQWPRAKKIHHDVLNLPQFAQRKARPRHKAVCLWRSKKE